jgi:hypothetical protein
MDARWNGEDHHMELAGFDGDADLNLPEPYSSMLALLQGLRCSASHLPAAVAGDHIRPQPSLQGRGSNRGGENRV